MLLIIVVSDLFYLQKLQNEITKIGCKDRKLFLNKKHFTNLFVKKSQI